MIQHWRANDDIQLILDPHAAITYMTHYATKAEKSGRSLQSIIKTITTKASSTDSVATAFKSAIIRSLGSRDIGQGECSRLLFSGHHCQSSLSFVTVSIDLENQEIVADPTTGNISVKESLLSIFSKRQQLSKDARYKDFNLHQPNFIEFCRQFKLVKGVLRRQTNPNKIVIITFPSPRSVPSNDPLYASFCRANYVKYAPWTVDELTSLLNDAEVIQKWEHFEDTCSDQLRQYFAMDLELKRRLQEAGNAIYQHEAEDEIVEHLQGHLA